MEITRGKKNKKLLITTIIVDKKEEIRIVKKAIKGKPDAYGQLISDFDSFDRVNAKGKAIL